MHIMEIVSTRAMNGAILHCLLLTRELTRRGHQVTLVCLPDSWIARQAAPMTDTEDPVRVILSDLHRWPTDELRRIAGVVRREGIDVVHTHTSRANFFGILLRWFSGVPSVATAHSRHIQLHWMFNDHVIAVSEATRRYQRIFNFVRASRIETIHNFIDQERLDPISPEARSRVRASLGLDEATPLIAAVGDVIPRKGLIHLVGAMPEILSVVPETRLMVVGDTWHNEYVTRVRSTAESLGIAPQISWLGYRHDVHDLLAAPTCTCWHRWKRAFRWASSRPWRPGCRWLPPRWVEFRSVSSTTKPASWCDPATARPWRR